MQMAIHTFIYTESVLMPQAHEIIDPISDEQIAHRKLRQDGCTGEVVYIIFATVGISFSIGF